MKYFKYLGLSILFFFRTILTIFWNNIVYVQIKISFWTLILRFPNLFFLLNSTLEPAIKLWRRIFHLVIPFNNWIHVYCIWIAWILPHAILTNISRFYQELVVLVTYWACTHGVDDEILFGCTITPHFLLDYALNDSELSLRKWIIVRHSSWIT